MEITVRTRCDLISLEYLHRARPALAGHKVKFFTNFSCEGQGGVINKPRSISS
jgi:hypothetical protein